MYTCIHTFICLYVHLHVHPFIGGHSCSELCSLCQRRDLLRGAPDSGQPVSAGVVQVPTEPLCCLLSGPCELCDPAVRWAGIVFCWPHPLCHQTAHAGVCWMSVQYYVWAGFLFQVGAYAGCSPYQVMMEYSLSVCLSVCLLAGGGGASVLTTNSVCAADFLCGFPTAPAEVHLFLQG